MLSLLLIGKFRRGKDARVPRPPLNVQIKRPILASPWTTLVGLSTYNYTFNNIDIHNNDVLINAKTFLSSNGPTQIRILSQNSIFYRFLADRSRKGALGNSLSLTSLRLLSGLANFSCLITNANETGGNIQTVWRGGSFTPRI